MFCPGCGVKEERPVQFCRTCGADLRAVRTSLEQPDLITASAIAAREEIGRAVAAMIKETDELKELEDVLPAVEKFLESPQERRLRRVREGVITAAAGLGAALVFLLLSLAKHDAVFLVGVGLVAFLVGLGLIINGLAFTVPKQNALEHSPDEQPQNMLYRSASSTGGTQRNLPPEQPAIQPASVTEQTTRHL